MSDQEQIAVIGSGVAGAAIAYQLASSGHRVTLLYRKENEGSSFTNQKWRHSGLLYPKDSLTKKAWFAYQKSNPLFTRFIYKSDADTPARFLALNKETLDERKRWWDNWNVKSWGLNWRELEVSEYKNVGAVGHTNALGGFETPDCIIDFPELIVHLRKATKELGAQVIAGADVKRLKVSKPHDRIIGLQYATNYGSYELNCDHCIVAMGAWTVNLLEASSIISPPIIRKKCIILTYDSELVPYITTCLDIQKMDGTRDNVTLVPFRGQTLAAGTDWEPTDDPNDQTVKQIDIECLVEEFAQCFPKIRDFKPIPHVCIKTERNTFGRAPDVERKIYGKTDLGVEGLKVIFPGKASFMFDLATDVVKEF